MDEAEPTAEGGSQAPGPGGRANQRERLEFEGLGGGVQARVDRDINMEIFHGGVQELFDRSGQAMDLVDEQHISSLEFQKHADQIFGLHQDRSRCRMRGGAKFIGDDSSQGGLAKPRRPMQKNMVQSAAAIFGCFQRDPESFHQFGLSKVVRQLFGTDRWFLALIVRRQLRRDDSLSRHGV